MRGKQQWVFYKNRSDTSMNMTLRIYFRQILITNYFTSSTARNLSCMEDTANIEIRLTASVLVVTYRRLKQRNNEKQ